MALRDIFYMHHADRQVMLTLLAVATVAIGVVCLTGGEEAAEQPMDTDTTMARTAQPAAKAAAPTYYQTEQRQVERFPFDPNTADSTQLLRLGLQPWQVRNIYKYRARGGVYRTKEDFARLYGLTVKDYRELEPYIRIGSDYLPASTLVHKTEDEPVSHDTLRYPEKLAEGATVNLATADTTLLRRVPGIGSYYARRIVQYRERLGGFVSADQLGEIEDFPMESVVFFTIDPSAIRKLDLNRLSLQELKRHPYINYYQARAITDHRRLHGPLHSLDDLRLLPDFPPETIDRLRPYVAF